MSETLELIKQRIELTERYHEAKENLGWLGSTVYYGFCLASIVYALSEQRLLHLGQSIGLWILCLVLFTGAIRFISLQFRMRWNANRREEKLDALLEAYPADYPLSKYMQDYADIQEDIRKAKRRCGQIALATVLWPLMFWLLWLDWPREGEYQTEIPAYAIALYLFVAQAVVIGCMTRF